MTADDAFFGLFVLLAICVGLMALWIVAEITLIGCALRLLFKVESAKSRATPSEEASR